MSRIRQQTVAEANKAANGAFGAKEALPTPEWPKDDLQAQLAQERRDRIRESAALGAQILTLMDYRDRLAAQLTEQNALLERQSEMIYFLSQERATYKQLLAEARAVLIETVGWLEAETYPAGLPNALRALIAKLPAWQRSSTKEESDEARRV